jgi:hypothetical protein
MSVAELPESDGGAPLGAGAVGSFLSTSPSTVSDFVEVVDAAVPVELDPDDPQATASRAQKVRRTAAAMSRRRVTRSRLDGHPLLVPTRYRWA